MVLSRVASPYQIPGYRTEALIYESSRTLVFQAQREEDDRPVVIKALAEEYPSPRSIALFQKEFEITQKFACDGVIGVYELQRHGQMLAMILEDFGGQSLHQHFKEAISPELFFKIAPPLIRALGEVHEQHVVHKDINPSNILWRQDLEQIRIIDFGIAGELIEETHEVNETPQGSPPYISPEQTGRMNRVVDYRTDYYGLGITFFKLLTGELPFQAEDVMGWVHAHITRTPVNPRALNPDLPEALARIVLKLIAKNAEDRYQSSRGLLLDLEKCRTQWLQNGQIEDFPLGRFDVAEVFHMPQKLYGRDEEITTLLNAFDEVAQGHSALMLVAGYAGVGKSSLINEVHRPIVSRHGYFIEGKFDQFPQNAPYTAVTRAFHSLVRQILAETPEKLAYWREQILEACGPNIQILVDKIPELERIIDTEKEPEPIEPGESQSLFLVVFRAFVKVFSREEHPLVLFLDDLQWADAATLSLIEYLLNDRDIGALFVIGAYRNNEVGPGHMLMVTIDEIQKHKPIYRLFLKPLDRKAVNQAIAEALACAPERCEILADLIYEKTEGNPFFVREVLRNMYREGLLRFVHDEGRWSWEEALVHKISLSDNVIQFMIMRLKKLPEETLELLRMAACIGSSFDLKTLSVIVGSSPSDIAERLWTAVREGIITPLGDRYRLYQAFRETDDYNAGYRFQHDQVQQAAYALIPENRRRLTHLQIGRMMLHQYTSKQPDGDLIDIVRHLNQGAELIEDGFERCELAKLNLKAGLAASTGNAYQPALDYFSRGIDLLPAKTWQDQYDLTYELHRECAQSAYLCKDFDRAETLIDILNHQVRTNDERADLQRMRMLQYTVLGRFEQAINAGREALALLDQALPNPPGSVHVFKETVTVRWQIGRRNLDDLVHAHTLTDEQSKLLARVLAQMITPAYLSGQDKVMALCVLRLVSLTLKMGPSPESATGLIGYGALLSHLFGDFNNGLIMGQLGLRLSRRFQAMEARCRALFLYPLFIHSWHDHWSNLTPYFRQAVEAGYQCGELTYTAYACIQMTTWDPQLSLSQQIEQNRKYLPVIKSLDNPEAWRLAKLNHHFLLNLQGLTDDRTTLSDPSFDESQCLVRMNRDRFITGVACFHLIKCNIHFLYGSPQEAMAHWHEADRHATGLLGQPYTVEHAFMGALLNARRYSDMRQRDKSQALKRIRKELKRMRRWTEHRPENFQHFTLLIEAELQRILDRADPELYDAAIKAAGKGGYLRYEALANELAAAFFLERGQEKIGRVYLNEAFYLYERWGAVAKTTELAKKHPWLIEQRRRRERPLTLDQNQSNTLTDSSGKDLDLAAVTKASQTLSDEVVLEKLLVKLIDIVRENAGAGRAILLLPKRDSGDLRIQAESFDNGDVRVMQSARLIEHKHICSAIVQYVARSLEPIVLADAAREGDFVMDDYIRREQPKSILAMPIIKAGDLVGILYLENNVATHAFTAARIEVLTILASKAAISIENAQLYHSLEHRVRERTAQLENAQRELIEAAHLAGMAEIANGVLHNVGNILNSINTSTDVALGVIDKSRLSSIDRANKLLTTNQDRLHHFLTEDPKGRQMPDFYNKLGEVLDHEQTKLRGEFEKIQTCANLIKDVITAQQQYAVGGLYTDVELTGIVEDTLIFQGGFIQRQGVEIVKKYKKTPKVSVQKSKLIHILTNLFKNAAEALQENDEGRRNIIIEVFYVHREAAYVKVRDNGMGIPKNRLNKIFTHGFTTKKDGHGFGLHTCANYMTDMGGNLTAYSDGPGSGAVFTLIFPFDENGRQKPPRGNSALE